MQGDLILMQCLKTEYGFDINKRYIWLGHLTGNEHQNSNTKYSLLVNRNGYIVEAPNCNFGNVNVVKPVKDVVCVFNAGCVGLKEGEMYSVYKVKAGNKKYKIVNDIYNFKDYDSYLFVDRDKFADNIDDAKFQSEREKAKKIHQGIYIDKNKKRIIESVLNSINKLNINDVNSITEVLKEDNKTIFQRLFKGKISFKKEKDEKMVRSNFQLEKLNSMPIHILGKIKIIENNILILKTMNVPLSILKLTYESIDLTLALLEYSSSDEVFERIDVFLDTTIRYCETLKSNKNIESSYIEERLAENIANAIENNILVLDSMVQDGDLLQKHIKPKVSNFS